VNEETKDAIASGFWFGIRLAESLGEIQPGLSAADRLAAVVDALTDVANGDKTVLPSGAELRIMLPSSEDDLESIRSLSQINDQETARCILSRKQL